MREEIIKHGKLCWRESPNLSWTDYTKKELTEKLIKLALNQNIKEFHLGTIPLKSLGQKCDKILNDNKDILYGS